LTNKLREIDSDFKAKYADYVTFSDSVDLADNYFATLTYLETDIPEMFKIH
jgi:hypothetical protein